MAVADVAVEMGPRNRRRLATGTIALGALGALVAALLLIHSPNHSRTGLSARSAQPRPSASNAHLVFGMTPQQVQRLTGPPTATQGSCWLFRPTKTGMVGSISVQPPWATVPYDPRTTGDLKLCFLGGVYSYASLHELDKRQHKWVWGAWPLARVPVPPQ